MKVSKFARTSGLAALTVAMVATSMPASAQDGRARSRYEEVTGQRGTQRDAERAERVEERSERRAERVEQRSEQVAQRVEQRGDVEARQAARQGDWRGARQADRSSERAAQQIERRGDREARQIERRGERQAQQIEQGRVEQAQRRDWQNRQAAKDQYRRDQQRLQERNRTYSNRTDNRWGNTQGDYRDGYRDARREYRQDQRQWNRQWRNDTRYNWQRYRSSNRIVFSVGNYYSPYRNYSYRRIGVGSRLQQLFFGRNYWISDPYRYRLPAVYGPYQWVRYYDDVLLVDTYSGQVVDVIYDFFW